MMIRGTTAHFKFKLPCTREQLYWVTVKFWQPGNLGTVEAPLPITKNLSDCSAASDANEFCVSLTASETERFSDKTKARVQFRAQRTDGTIFGNKLKYITVYPMDDGIIDDETPPHLPETDSSNGLMIFDAGEIIK